MAGYLVTRVNQYGFRVHTRHYANPDLSPPSSCMWMWIGPASSDEHLTTYHPDVDAAYAAIGVYRDCPTLDGEGEA